jgi:NAD(P)-dependent dehydrogenase (short-subunit alcohol dehydrogenase family)
MGVSTVIITGASSGIGAATVRWVSRLGANVVLFARSKDGLDSVEAEIQRSGGPAFGVAGDIRQPRDCQRLIESTLDRFGTIDGLVNNAGIVGPMGSVAEGDFEAWRQNWEVNVLGPVRLTQMAIPHLRQSSGRIVNVSSGFAIKPVPGLAAYCTAKAALNQFTRVLAEEETSLTALSIRPGAVDTALQREIREQADGSTPKPGVHIGSGQFDGGDLLSPEVPGQIIAVLALHAPRAWNGDFLSWNDERVQELVKQYLPP